MKRSRYRLRTPLLNDNIASLFAAGEQGGWYDPSDLSTLFQDSAGTTPVTALGQPVGRINDKSGRGNNLTQTTPTSRPTLEARVNLLLRSEEFDNAAWGKALSGTGSAPVVTPNAGAAPDGTATADRIQFTLNGGTTVSDWSSISQSVTVVSGRELTHSIWLRSNDGNSYQVQFRDDSALSAAAIVVTVTPSWQRFVMSGTATSSASSGPRLWLRGTQGTSATADILAWGAQTEISATPSTYQRVTTATDYADVGAPRYLQFDGADDFLTIGTFNVSASDKVTVCAGVRKNTDANDQAVVCELGVNSATTNGFALMASPALVASWRLQLFGTSRAVRDTSSTFPAPDTTVITGALDIAGATVAQEIIGRRNGVERFVVDVLSPAGTGNLPSAALFVGRRNGATNPFNGRIFGLVIRGGASGASEIAALERYMAQKTGIAV